MLNSVGQVGASCSHNGSKRQTEVAGAWPLHPSWPLHPLQPSFISAPVHAQKLQLLNINPLAFPWMDPVAM